MDLAWLKLQNCNKIAGVNPSSLHLSAEGMKRGRDWVDKSWLLTFLPISGLKAFCKSEAA